MADNTLVSIKADLACLPNILDDVSHLTPNKDDWKEALCKEKDIIAEAIYNASQNDIMEAEVTLTAAQIRSLVASPVELLPTLPSNQVYILTGGYAYLSYSGGAFANAYPYPAISIGRSGADIAIADYALMTLGTSAASSLDLKATVLSNVAIYVRNTSPYEFTNNSATSTLKVKVYYRIETL